MNVLCIDDDPITLMLCKKVIEKVNFASNIFTSNNGEEALDFFNSLNLNNEFEKIDVVFLDLNMPIMNGWEFQEYDICLFSHFEASDFIGSVHCCRTINGKSSNDFLD